MGDSAYVEEVLRQKAHEIQSYIADTVDAFHDQLRSRHALWSVLFSCCASRFDFWIRHVPPDQTRLHALAIDDAMRAAGESLGSVGMLQDPIIRRRWHLPSRFRGCGIRSRDAVAPAAYAA